ncbi:hypothetical protein O181_000339 [Austropuccinia psidii MF-1]|uniref:FAD synthase n=1 Tax=Austropuccinia psidii MF-1 TaxID=1389203 RepID=A0A9Q3B8E2_9BASI|nr:hypothetical protein [Austropuccinia psidii MF-1]
MKMKQSRPFCKEDADRIYDLAYSQSPTGLSEPVRQALDVIESAMVRFGNDGLSISFNGGKDCTVLVHLFAAALIRNSNESVNELPKIKSLYIKSKASFAEVDQFVHHCESKYNLDLMSFDGTLKEGLSDFMEKNQNTIKAILIGTRSTDPRGASLKAFDPTDDDWPSIVRVHPILEWNYNQVWHFLRLLEVDWCELYNQGYTSLGSSLNTFPNPLLKTQNGWKGAWELEDPSGERAGRFVASIQSAG